MQHAAGPNCTRKEKLPLFNFKLSIAAYLCRANKKAAAEKRGRPSVDMVQLAAKVRRGPAVSVPQQDIRTVMLGHWPMPCDKKGRCKRPGCNGTQKKDAQQVQNSSLSNSSQQLLLRLPPLVFTITFF